MHNLFKFIFRLAERKVVIARQEAEQVELVQKVCDLAIGHREKIHVSNVWAVLTYNV